MVPSKSTARLREIEATQRMTWAVATALRWRTRWSSAGNHGPKAENWATVGTKDEDVPPKETVYVGELEQYIFVLEILLQGLLLNTPTSIAMNITCLVSCVIDWCLNITIMICGFACYHPSVDSYRY